jgi:hypothetical protein
MISLALAITHSAFDKRRVESMARLKDQLRLADLTGASATVPAFGRVAYHEEVSEDPTPPHVWSRRQWAWAADQSADVVLHLQDDVVVAPDFWEQLEKVYRAWRGVGVEWVNLLTHHPGSRQAFLDGCAGYTTLDGLMGCGYLSTPEEFKRVLAFRWYDLVPGVVEKLNEDVLLSLYCLWAGQRIYTPVPGLIDHDLGVGTIRGVEHYANRRAYVRWDDRDRKTDATRTVGPFVVDFGRFYATAHAMLPGVLLDEAKGLALAAACEDEQCPAPYNRYFERIVAQKDWP